MQKIKDFFKNNQDKIILTIGAILIASCSFAAGRISIDKQNAPIEIQENNQPQEVKIEQPQPDTSMQKTPAQKKDVQKNAPKKQEQAKSKPENATKITETTETAKENCEFVASSRGKKYYKAGSSSAKSLSEKNIICFPDEKTAEKAGYEPSASLK